MNHFDLSRPISRRRTRASRVFTFLAVGVSLLLGLGIFPLRAAEDEDNALELEFADVLMPDTKLGFMLRADTWSGSLPKGESKPIAHQFFKGNEYHLYVRTDVAKAKVSIHVYDGDGNLAEKKSWQKESLGGSFACAEIIPKYTGRYYLMVKVEESTEPSTEWAMAYAYK